jgi:hypothetical protein
MSLGPLSLRHITLTKNSYDTLQVERGFDQFIGPDADITHVLCQASARYEQRVLSKHATVSWFEIAEN